MVDLAPGSAEKAAEVEATISKEVDFRKGWNSTDFRISQSIGWITILSSAVATIITAYGPGDGIGKLFLAVLTTLLGLMVAVENSFKFSIRYKMNTKLMYDLITLRSSLARGRDSYEVEAAYIETMTKFEESFPAISMPALPGNKT